MRRLNVMVVFGTRPEAVKLAAVVQELRRHSNRIRTVVTATGQHREMLDQMIEVFRLAPDYDLNLMKHSQPLAEITSAVLTELHSLLTKESIDFLLVQGDTTTTFAAGLSAAYHQIPVGHVEAGLRTRDKRFPFPEEINRVLTSHLSSLHFAPTEQAKRNLLREGVPEDSILVTGNTVIDAFLQVLQRDVGLLDPCGSKHRQILVTAHRRESWGEPLAEICRAIRDILAEHSSISVLFPVHPNRRVQETVQSLLGGLPRVKVTAPLVYPEFVRELAASHLILTDSGGIQEEAPAIGKPVLVLRNETERQEGVDAGTCRLIGTDRQRIVEAVRSLLCDPVEYSRMARAVNPYGDGKAAARIVNCILERFC